MVIDQINKEKENMWVFLIFIFKKSSKTLIKISKFHLKKSLKYRLGFHHSGRRHYLKPENIYY